MKPATVPSPLPTDLAISEHLQEQQAGISLSLPLIYQAMGRAAPTDGKMDENP